MSHLCYSEESNHSEENTCDNEVFRSTILHHRKKLKVVFATFLLVCFICLKESTYETRKNVFYLTLKALFVLEIIKF